MLDLDFVLYAYLGFVFYVFFHVSLGHCVLVLLAFVVLGLVSSVLSHSGVAMIRCQEGHKSYQMFT